MKKVNNMTNKSWEEEFDKEFVFIGELGEKRLAILRTNNYTFDTKIKLGDQVIDDLKSFISKVEQEAYERGVREAAKKASDVEIQDRVPIGNIPMGMGILMEIAKELASQNAGLKVKADILKSISELLEKPNSSPRSSDDAHNQPK